MTSYEAVIGLEVHVQLGTASKTFSPSGASFGAPPNSLTDPTVLALPGALPVLNRHAVELAVQLGLATGCEIRTRSRFARKHYFYPDLPKGYQISQYDEPLCEHGAVELVLDGQPRTVRLTRIHMEEDAGKNLHETGAASRVDLNRAGVPLCEIVSEPDIRSAQEAAQFVRAVRQLVRWLGISDGNMEQGSLRCDANISLRPVGQQEYGTRVELKNINSFKFVQNAIEYEIVRQTVVLDGGGAVAQETRLWDADAGISRSMRGKEEANDYRYFPDPDLPPLVIDDALLARVKAELPELPAQTRARYTDEYGLSLDDAVALTSDRARARWYDAAVEAHGVPAAGAKPLANLVQTIVAGSLNRDGLEFDHCPVRAASLAALQNRIDDGTISGTLAKQVWVAMYQTGDEPDAIIEREGLVQITDVGVIENIAREVISANPVQVQSYRGGKQKLFGFFVGQVMRATKGKANPQAVNDVLRRMLEGGS